MYKTLLIFAASASLVAQGTFAADKDASPLTPDIKAALHAEVITIVAEVSLTPEGVAKVLELGPAYIAKSRKEPGCVQYQLQFDAVETGHIFWYEQYANQEAFEKHVTSAYSKEWVSILEPLETKPIVIHFLNKIEHLEK